MDIKEEVYELLWELFENECPLFAKLQANNGNDVYDDGFIVWINEKSEREQIWTILNEILPSGIKTDKCYGLIIDPHSVCVQYGYLYPRTNVLDLLFGLKSANNIWQAILSLLKAIESHGERDNLKFVWGE